MMGRHLSITIRKFVAARANYRCEYCKKPEIIANFSFHIEHIISRQHNGSDHLSNLAYACSWCNWKKGPNIATRIPQVDELIPLFNPRKDTWTEHFELEEGILIGKTPIAQGTIQLLDMNTVELIIERQELAKAGLFP